MPPKPIEGDESLVHGTEGSERSGTERMARGAMDEGKTMRRGLGIALGLLLVFGAGTSPASAGHTIVVDDDGAQCPGAHFADIHSAVAAADGGSTVRVCPGTYTGTVTISGPGKNGLRLVAQGGQGEVILDGNPAADAPVDAPGIVLADVSGVLVEGFTVLNFHDNIRLLAGADGNTIRGNAMMGPSLHDGILLEGANGNLIERNTADGNGTPVNGCGIDLLRGASDNIVRSNTVSANMRAGIRLQNAGPGNVVEDNEATAGGRNGVLNLSTDGSRIEGNRIQRHPGMEADPGAGIRVLTSSGVVVTRNEAFDSSGFDLLWDQQGAGDTFAANRCGTSSPDGLCQAPPAAAPPPPPAPARPAPAPAQIPAPGSGSKPIGGVGTAAAPAPARPPAQMPRTGDLGFVLPLLGAAGAGLAGVGLALRRLRTR